jgi:hypothetical protein
VIFYPYRLDWAWLCCRKSLIAAEYVILATSLPEQEFPAGEVLAVYRLRWHGIGAQTAEVAAPQTARQPKTKKDTGSQLLSCQLILVPMGKAPSNQKFAKLITVVGGVGQ